MKTVMDSDTHKGLKLDIAVLLVSISEHMTKVGGADEGGISLGISGLDNPILMPMAEL